jgi:hypothetical protein
MSRGFCSNCGSRLLLKNSAYSSALVIHASSLDDPSWVEVEMNIYTESAQPWDYMDPERLQFPHMPALEELK